MRLQIPLLLLGILALTGCVHTTRSVSVNTVVAPPGERLKQYGDLGFRWSAQASPDGRKISLTRIRPGISDGLTLPIRRKQTQWYVFVENDERLWAFDGYDALYLVYATPDYIAVCGPGSHYIAPVPLQVLSRLTEKAKRKNKVHEG